MVSPLLSPDVEAYVDRRWSVIPLTAGNKTPAIAWKPHQKKRMSLDELYSWAEAQPSDDFNVGIVTGQISGIIVLDVDGPEGIASLVAMGAMWPETPAVETSNGKAHYYFKHPMDVVVKNFVRKIAGVDLRGDGGYVVAPPSLHTSGSQYVWRVSPDDAPLAETPEWLLNLVTPPTSVATPAVSQQAQGTKYGLAALSNEIETLTATPNGGRNDQLNRTSFALGQLVAVGALDYHTTLEKLVQTGGEIGLLDNEVAATVQSGLQSGLNQPRDTTSFHAPMTDSGNAELFSHQHGAGVRYVGNWGQWIMWNGRYWQTDEVFRVYEMAKNTARTWLTKADKVDNDKIQEAMITWSHRSESRAGISSLLDLARGRPGITVRSADLDSDPWQLNVRNGSLNLRTGEILEHRAEDLNTKVADVIFAAEAPAPKWEAFLDRIFRGDQELISYVQRAIGYSLTGVVSEQCLFFMYGHGANGKSTFVEVLLFILADYAKKCPASMVMASKYGGIPNDVARLEGTRLAVASELHSGKLNEAVVKDLTGGDTIVARYLRQEFFEFNPTHKLWMYGNHKPIIQGVDNGIWRKIRLIPFDVRIPKEEQDPFLIQKLLEEAPGILAWAVRGLTSWREGGLGVCEVVETATKAYRSEMDLLGLFLEDTCVHEVEATVTASALYATYQEWSNTNGIRPLSSTMFGRVLTERGLMRGHDGSRKERVYKGLRIGRPKELVIDENTGAPKLA